MAFSASEAAFEGFRLVKREPVSVLAWAIVQLGLSAAMMTVMMPDLRAARALSDANAEAAGPAAIFAAMGGAMRLYLAIIVIALVSGSVLKAAVYRSVLRPKDKGLARLKLGGDELRLAGLWILLGLFILGGSMLVMIAAIIAAVALGGGLAAAGVSNSSIIGVGIFASYALVLILVAWVLVRLSLAGPMTFAEKRLQLFQSWRLTKGRFWSLFGCYLLAYIFCVLLWLVIMILEAAVSIAAAGGALRTAAEGLFHPDVSSLRAYFSPVRLAVLPIAALLGAVSLAVGAAPAARAYKDIVGPDEAAIVS